MKKALFIFVFALVILIAAMADGESEYDISDVNGASDSVLYDGDMTISIGVFGDLESSIGAIVSSRDFRSKFPRVIIELQGADTGSHHDRLVTQIAAGAGANDIEAIDIGYLARFAADGGLEDLSKAPYYGLEAGKDIVKFAMSNSTTTDGKLLAMPLDVSPAVLFYRKSVCDDAGVNMDNIASWEEYIEKAKILTLDKNGDGIADQFALANPLDAVTTFLNGGKGSWFENGEPYIPKDRFVKALNYIRQIRKSGIDANFTAWSGEWINSFSEGNVVTIISGHWLGSHLRNWMAPGLSGDWRVTYLPGKTASSYGGTYLAIPRQTDQAKKTVCFEIIKYLCADPNAQLLMLKTTDAFPALTSVYANPEMDEPREYFGGQRVRQLYVDILLNIPEQYVSEFDNYAADIFYKAAGTVINDETPVEQAYKEMKTEMKAQM